MHHGPCVGSQCNRCARTARGCGQIVSVRDGRITNIEGDPASPISRRAGSAPRDRPRSTRDRVVPARTGALSPARAARSGNRSRSTTRCDMVALREVGSRHRVGCRQPPPDLGVRPSGWRDARQRGELPHQEVVHRVGCDPDREPGADITFARRFPAGTSFGRGGATTFQQDLANSDCIVIQGSNMAECHPVGFQWVMEAKAARRDRSFTSTRVSLARRAMADLHVPLRAGSDIVFLGGIVDYILSEERYFSDYVVAYTNVLIDPARRLPGHGGPRRPVQRSVHMAVSIRHRCRRARR